MNLQKMAIDRPIFLTCVVLLMLIVGALSFKKMSVDLFPDVTFPIISVQTIYPGAAPRDVEQLVSKLIEEEVGSLSGVKRVISNNLESVSVVIIEFRLGIDVRAAEQQVRDRLQNLRRSLPTEIQDPVVRRFDPSDQPILRLAVKSELPINKLVDIIDETIKPQFDRIDGVGQVQIIGGRKREIQVLVDKQKLQDRELSVTQIANHVAATSKDVPIGKLENPGRDTIVRAIGEFKDFKQLGQVNVSFLGSDRSVKLSEVAQIVDGLETEKTRSSLNGEQAVFLEIYKQSGANTVQVADNVKGQVEIVNDALKRQKVSATLGVVRDVSRPIRLNVADVKDSILIGIALCIVVVFFFLGSFRSTFITGLALPNSLLGAFIMMYAFGFTINVMTLLSLSLAVGLLVDDAIVVRENIFRHLEMGKAPKKAALEGTQEVALAVLATTAVVMAVFGPISYVEGIVGQFFKQFGLTMVFAMLISLFDAMTIAPMLSAYLASASEHVRTKGIISRMLGGFDRFQTWLEDIYTTALKFTLRKPLVILSSALLIFFGSLVLLKFIPKTFLPPADNGEFEVRLELPPGTPLETTSQVAKKVDETIRVNKSVELTATVTGNSSGEVNKAIIFVKLVARKQRKGSTTDVKVALRGTLSNYKDIGLIKVQDIDIGGSGQRPFTLNVSGQDLETLIPYVEKLKNRMAQIPGLIEIDTNFRTGKPEFQVVFDRNKTESLGVATAQVGAELRNRTEGVVAAVFRDGEQEYDVRVRLQEKDRDLKREFASTLVPNVNLNMVPLNLVASGQETLSVSQINRENKARYIQISADIGPGGALDTLMKQTEKILASELPLPPGVTSYFVGQAQDFKDLIANMLVAMFLGVTFIYLVLASLYESFITPFTILLALPLGICGALAALFIVGASINIFSLIGVVMLLGVVAKNSILLVDYTQHLLREGVERKEALLRACKTRLRPILMTSFALIAGMIPIAIGLNEASAQRTSMGIAIIGGLVSSTFLTLLVVPAAYGYIDDFRLFILRFISRFQGRSGTGTGTGTGSGIETHELAAGVVAALAVSASATVAKARLGMEH